MWLPLYIGGGGEELELPGLTRRLEAGDGGAPAEEGSVWGC